MVDLATAILRSLDVSGATILPGYGYWRDGATELTLVVEILSPDHHPIGSGATIPPGGDWRVLAEVLRLAFAQQAVLYTLESGIELVWAGKEGATCTLKAS